MHFVADKFAEVAVPAKSYNFIYIDNPNNPTGQCIDIEEIEKIVAGALKKDITVIIDEADGEFMPKENSAIRLFAEYPNLVVVHTMSNGFGLAGLRIGYIIAHKDMISCMKKMVNPYMVGELSREVAAEALKHNEFITRSKRAFAGMKKEIRRELGCTRHNPEGASGRLHMAETLDTNSLLLLYHDDQDIDLRDEFYKRGVLVIDGYDFKGLDSTSARVRLPKKEEFPKLLEAIKKINAL
jgi:histidinol-phosphate aminotransferase